MTRFLWAWAVLGLAMVPTADAAALFSTGATWRLRTGQTEASSPDTTAWRSIPFDDSSFSNAPAPFWYGDVYPGGTQITNMQNNYLALFLRRTFVVTNLADIGALRLGAFIDDGFVAWINGVEVARVNVAAGAVSISTTATNAIEPVPFVLYDLPAPSSYLLMGTNVLAVQVFNTSLGSTDIGFDASLTSLSSETNPPAVSSSTPSANAIVTNLTQITVTFSEPVSGVDAGDFLIDGSPADNVSGSGATYTFSFAQPPYGSVQLGWRANHGITDQAFVPNAFDQTAPDANWFYTLVDVVPPTVTGIVPPPGFTLQNLAEIEVTFSEDVLHVDAADLRINGQPATNVTYTPGGPFIFRFPPPDLAAVTVAWAPGHGIIDLATVPNPFAGGSWSYTIDPNSGTGDVIINEFVADNEIGLKDETGETQGWIELYNRGGTAVNLANWALSDDPELPGLWSFPPRTLGPGAYLVVFASGKDIKAPTGTNRLHTNFKLNGHGEHLGLYSPASPRVLVHGFSPAFPEQRNDNSYGYDTNGVLRYFATPTPGGPNGASTIVGVVAPVHFGVARGFFTQPFTLTLSSETRDAHFRYTTDGREPTELTGTLYTAPLRVTNTAVFRAIGFRPNYLPSASGTHTYIFNASAAVKSLPVLSLVTATNNLYGPSGIVGISGGTGPPNNPWVPLGPGDYHNTDRHGVAWERPLSAELIQPADNSGFQVNCGIRVHGSDYTRPRYLATDKFAYRLFFRGAYGGSKLDYPFFPGAAVQSFDHLVLRAGHNDVNPFIRDEMTRRLDNNLGAVTIHGNLVNLFINGQYMGFYNPTEHTDENWISSWYQSEQHWDVIKQFSTVVNGDLIEYNSFNTYLLGQNVTVPAVYQEVARRFDLTNFVDYLLLNVYEGMGDWPANNWAMHRERSTNGVWRYAVWDGEWGCGIYGRAVTRNTFTEAGGGPDDGGLASVGSADIARYYQQLRNSAEFRQLFADRIHKHFFNGGALTDANISLMHTGLRAAMLPVLPSYDNGIATTWIPARRGVIMPLFNLYGLIASSNAPVFNRFGGRVPRGFNLSMALTNGSGTIYFTTNGGDPRVMFTAELASNAVAYSGPVALGQTAVVRARTLNGTNWSAVTEANFEVASLGIPLRITEIMYNPSGGSVYEFIELQNVGSTPLDLSAMYFGGITFTFPPNSTLAAGARLVLGSNTDPISFAARYPGVPVFGRFGGTLNNLGEKITLRDHFGQIIISVDYNNTSGWAARANGAGYSLEVVDPLGDPDDPANWRASQSLNGTPGAPPAPPAVAEVRLNEIMATNFTAVANSGTYPDWIELYNAGAGGATLDGWSLTDDSDPRKFVFPAGTAIAVGDFLVVWCDDTTNTTPGLHTGFSLSRAGDNVQLYDASTNLVDEIGFGLQLTDYSIGRIDGSWGLNSPTPNAANIAASVASPTNLVINEWLANAPPGLPDWLELYNSAAQPVALRGCWLTTTSAIHQITSLSFVGAGGYVQLFADENVGADHLDFKLSAAGETISLYDPLATLVNSVTYSNAVEGVSRGRLPDGSANLVNFIGTVSPGAGNYAVSYSGPVLNEVLARNVSVVTNAQGRLADFVELYNTNSSSFSLAGFSLSVDSVEPGQWIFPAGATVAGRGFVVVWCDGGQPASTNAGSYNTGRSLNGESGGASLFNPAGQLVNFVEYGFQVADRSIGLSGGAWRLLSSPTPGATNATNAALGPVTALRLNEWMANPISGSDWFEVYNTDTLPVDLGGLYFTDDPSLLGQTEFKAAALSFIGPLRWVKWEADGDTAAGRNHVTFNLNAQGGSLRIYTTNFTLIDAVYFASQTAGASEGRLPDATDSIVRFPGSPTPGESNYLLPLTVLINEVLTHAVPPLEDAIELRNPSSVAVNLGGWYLSDSPENFRKYRITDNTFLLAGGYRVFYENQFGGPGGFALDSARGGEVWLSQADGGGKLTGYRTTAKFGAALNSVSLGRFVTHLSADIVALGQRSFGSDTPDSLSEFRSGGGLSNAYPKVGPVAISEIMYHPPVSTNSNADPDDEYIELHNISASAAPLHDPAHPTNTWRLANAVSFAFPAGLSLPAQRYLLVVSFDPVADPARLAAFRAKYSLSLSVNIYGPYSGKLNNNGEQLELYQPDAPEPDGFVPQVLVERINYTATVPWPGGATDGGGLSLQRRNDAAYANDPENWLASAATPGAANGPGIVAPPVLTSSPQGFNALVGAPAALNVIATGSGPLAYQWRFNQANIPGATNATFVFKDLLLDDEGEYDAFVSNAGGSAFSQSATVRVDAPPVFLISPQSATVRGGTNVSFSVLAVGAAPLVYEWRFNGVPIPGATGPSLLLTNVGASHSGDYTVLVSNRVSAISSTVTLAVLVTPVITQQPQGATVLQGATVTFTASASGSPQPLSFRWRKNPGGFTLTNLITFGTNSTFTIVNAQPFTNGTYTVVVTNLAGASPLSGNAVLTVLADSDGDGIADDWERLYGFNTNSLADASSDPDMDGMSNLQEYLAGTNPTNGLSYLKIDSIVLNGGGPNSLLLSLSAVSNHTYTIICRDDVASGVWARLADIDARTTNRVVTITNQLPVAVTNRFYRLQTPRLP